MLTKFHEIAKIIIDTLKEKGIQSKLLENMFSMPTLYGGKYLFEKSYSNSFHPEGITEIIELPKNTPFSLEGSAVFIEGYLEGGLALTNNEEELPPAIMLIINHEGSVIPFILFLGELYNKEAIIDIHKTI